MPEFDEKHVAAWTDLLVPGDGVSWPSASSALGDDGAARCLVSALGAQMCGDWFAGAPSTDALVAKEHERPEAFNQMLSGLYRAYYTSPMVRAVIDTLAVSGPVEKSPYFDESLLAPPATSGAPRPPR